MNVPEDIVRQAALTLASSPPEAALAHCQAALEALEADDPRRATLEVLAEVARFSVEERRAALEIRERLDMLSRASFEGLLVHVDGVVVAANTRLSEIVGYAEDEVIGLDAVQVLVAPESRPEVQRRMTEGVDGVYVITAIRKDGSRFPAEIYSKQGHVGDRPAHVVGVRDVTDREGTARRLHESEERLRRLIDHTFDVTTISRDGVLVSITGDVERLFGHAPDHFLGRTVMEFVASGSQDLVATIVREQREGPYEAAILHADGSHVPVLVVSTPASLDGADVRIAGLKDLREARRADEERRELEQQVERAQRLESLGVLAGGIAHDFNNLLVGILGNADMLREHVDGAEARAQLDGIINASQRAAELTSQMLAYGGRGSLERRGPIDLEGLVEDLASLLQASISKKATLEIDFCDPRSYVLADRAGLGQVVLNLLTNASDALGQRPGVISVRTRRVAEPGPEWTGALGTPPLAPGDWVLLEVSDDGQGMDPPTLARIFEPFFTTKPRGHGLGLAACLGIVRSHGGAIRVESSPGEGTRFHVLLPRVRGETTPPEATPEETSLPEPRSVLVVDDEPAIRAFVRSALEWAAFTVDEAVDGQEALDLLDRRTYDLVLLDLSMPRLDGAEVVRRLRDRGDDVPVILTSGYADVDVDGRLEQGSFQGFLRKPYRVKALFEVLRTVLPRD